MYRYICNWRCHICFRYISMYVADRARLGSGSLFQCTTFGIQWPIPGELIRFGASNTLAHVHRSLKSPCFCSLCISLWNVDIFGNWFVEYALFILPHLFMLLNFEMINWQFQYPWQLKHLCLFYHVYVCLILMATFMFVLLRYQCLCSYCGFNVYVCLIVISIFMFALVFVFLRRQCFCYCGTVFMFLLWYQHLYLS